LVFVAVAVLVAAACGRGGNDQSKDTTTTSAESSTTPSNAPPTTTALTTTAAPTTTTTTWGVRADKVLIGPGGLQVNLAACPESWQDQQGISAERILLGASGPFTGPAAPIGLSLKGYEARLAQANTQGGIAGRSLEMVVLDDGWDPQVSAADARTLIDSHGVMALTGLYGTKQADAASAVASPACVPQVVLSPHPALSDAATRPWLVPTLSSWMSDITAMLQTIAGEQPTGVTLAVVSDDDREYGDSLVRYATAAAALYPNVTVLPAVRVPAGTTDGTAIAAQVAAGQPTALIVGMTSTATEPVLRALHASNAAAEARFVTSAVQLQRLVAAGVEGWRTVRSPDAPQEASGTLAAGFLEAADAAGLSSSDRPVFWIGYANADLLLQALKSAAQLPGGLSRTNLLLALWSMQTTHPAVPGLKVHANGPADPVLVEGGVLSRLSGGVLVPIGVVDVDGRSPRCPGTDIFAC
jgi:ABC-type branched-subunit amino acid transport system substrate-binding protein